MCTCVIYSAAETSGQLYSPPPQPLFTTPANHISSIIHFYGTHRITIMITKITTHINFFFFYCRWEDEWVNEWVNAFSLFSVFFSRGLKHASISLQLWLQLILIHGFVWYVLFRIIFHLGNFWSGNPPCRILWHIWRCRIIVFLSYSLCTFIVQLKVIPSSQWLSVYVVVLCMKMSWKCVSPSASLSKHLLFVKRNHKILFGLPHNASKSWTSRSRQAHLQKHRDEK